MVRGPWSIDYGLWTMDSPERLLRKLRQHQPSAHRGALGEQIGPVFRTAPRGRLDRRDSVRVARRQLGGEGVDRIVQRADIRNDTRVESMALRRTCVAPVGIELHGSERLGANP